LSLGDFFPVAEQQRFVDGCLKAGAVLYLRCDFTDPPKDKYILVACVTDPPKLFLINSEIPRFVAKRPKQKASQVKLKASDYSFLQRDSYVNCAEVVDVFDEDAIRNQLMSQVSRCKGEITQNTKNAVIAAVKRTRQISDYDKELITAALRNP
jgi:hypothetical protein